MGRSSSPAKSLRNEVSGDAKPESLSAQAQPKRCIMC